VLGFLLLSGIGQASARKPAPSIDRVILEMERVREEIQDLTVTVERTIAAEPGRTQRTAEILVSYRRPDRLRTEVKGADARLVVIKEERMWVYSPGLEMVEIYNLEGEEERERAIYQSSWGLTSPIKVLVRGMNRTLSVLPDGSYQVDLVPDQKDSEIERITAWVDPLSWLITRMEIRQPGRPPTTLAIKDWRANRGVADAAFDFTPPPGTDVFDPLQKSGGRPAATPGSPEL
jgi:outer membrane lipoprotein-sorting protein